MLHKDFLEAFDQIHSYTEYDFKDLKVLIEDFATTFLKRLLRT